MVWMTKEGQQKEALTDEVKEILEADGWTAECEEPKRRGRKPKDEE